MTGLLGPLLWLFWGALWTVLSLALSLKVPGWAGQVSLPLAIAAVAGLGARVPGGLGGAVVASLALDAWSLRVPFVEALVVGGLGILVWKARRTFEVVNTAGQAAILGLGFAGALIAERLLTILLDRNVPALAVDRVLLAWAFQTGVALLMARALPVDPDELSLPGRR